MAGRGEMRVLKQGRGGWLEEEEVEVRDEGRGRPRLPLGIYEVMNMRLIRSWNTNEQREMGLFG